MLDSILCVNTKAQPNIRTNIRFIIISYYIASLQLFQLISKVLACVIWQLSIFVRVYIHC